MPALLVLAVWLVVQPMVVNGSVAGMIPADRYDSGGTLNLIMSDRPPHR